MNILIPDSWLREFLETGAKPSELAHALSLCSASVERVEKFGDDYIYNIEVTTNRPDLASVLGIAREAAAALPRFGIKAKLKDTKIEKLKNIRTDKVDYLTVKITNPTLCPRFTAILLENVEIGPSPSWLQKRLALCGIRALNSVVDISNYVMVELGQPTHTFDYDKIGSGKMVLRESQRGEEITTLDGAKRRLPKGVIVIEDGKGRLIDLCGIMGAENSAIDEKTKRVLLFVQTYDPVRIRHACQTLSFRTQAATLFEKSLDPENVIPALNKGVELFEKLTGAKVAERVIDLYPKPYKPKQITLNLSLVERILGIKIPPQEIKSILDSLGFENKLHTTSYILQATIPSWRADDISISEDLIEEIARVYGYHNLPSALPTGQLPNIAPDPKFYWENKVKNTLKNWGFTETYTYSLISKDDLKNCNFEPQEYLRVSNPLTEEWEYLRPSLIPGNLKVLAENSAQAENLRLFELSHVYLPKKTNLPEERLMLTGLLDGEKFYETKGIVEALLEELGIKNCRFTPTTNDQRLTTQIWLSGKTAVINDKLGTIGEIKPSVLEKFGANGKAVVFDLDFTKILSLATTQKQYRPIPKYPPIIEDLSIIAPPKVLTTDITETIQKASKLIVDVSLFDQFKDARTFRITYQHPQRNLKTEEIAKIRQNLLKILKQKFGAKLKE